MTTKQRTRNEKGRFAKETAGEEDTEPVMDEPAAVGAPRPRQCRDYARKRLAESAPALVDAFLREARGGSVQHLKALMDLTGITKDPVKPKVKRRRGKSVAAQLLEELGE